MLRQAFGRLSNGVLRGRSHARSTAQPASFSSLLDGAGLAKEGCAQEHSQLPSLSTWFVNSWRANVSRQLATAPRRPGDADDKAATSGSEADEAQEASTDAGPGETSAYAQLTIEQLQDALIEKDSLLETASAQAADTTDRLKRTLADMENLRQRTAKQAEASQKFAIQGFLKSLLDVGDNLERAHGAIPAEALQGRDQGGGPLSAEKALGLLRGIVNGVQLTEKIFDQALRENGVEKFRPEGEKFDPNRHEALFEMPDPSKEPGLVGAVTKTGYTLHGRVVRPAQVGVVRAPS